MGVRRLTMVACLLAVGCGGPARLQPLEPATQPAPHVDGGSGSGSSSGSRPDLTCAPSTDPCLQTAVVDGACVTTARDGAACVADSPCNQTGLCRAGRCEAQDGGSALIPSWTVTAGADESFVATAAEPGGPLGVIAWRQSGSAPIAASLRLLDAQGSPLTTVELPRTGPGDYAPNVLHAAGGQLYVSATAIRAFDAKGSLRWTHDLRFDLAGLGEPTPAPSGWFQTVELLDDGAGHVIASVAGVLGSNQSGAWVFELDRQSGATLRLLAARHDGGDLFIASDGPGRILLLTPHDGDTQSVLRCVLGDGSTAWSLELPAHAERMRVFGDQVWVSDLVAPGPGGVSVIDAATGTLLTRTPVEPTANEAPDAFRLGERGLAQGAAGCLTGTGCKRGNAHQAAPVATYLFNPAAGKLELERDGMTLAGAWVTARDTLLAEDMRFENGALHEHLLEIDGNGQVANDCAAPDEAFAPVWLGEAQIAAHGTTVLHGYRVPGLTPK